MVETTDDVVRGTHKSADEYAWEREQRSKRRKKPDPPAPTTGPCCQHCQHWRAPETRQDRFGRCAVLRVVTKRLPPPHDLERGQVLPIGQARGIFDLEHEALSTTAGFSCTAFERKAA